MVQKKLMRQLLSILLLLFFGVAVSGNAQYSDFSFYVSPGVSIGWENKTGAIFGWKISLGYSKMGIYYYNITFGKKSTLPEKTPYYYYAEIQSGYYPDYLPIITGVGLGATFLNNHVYPRVSFSGGLLLFANIDYTFKAKLYNMGGSLVFPYPFNKHFRDFRQ